MAARPPLRPAAAAGSDAAIGGGFYGRGKVKKLSDRKKSLVGEALPQLRISASAAGAGDA